MALVMTMVTGFLFFVAYMFLYNRLPFFKRLGG